MERELKLHDVVTRAVLNERTARYVLDRAKAIGVPAGTGRGNHRVFSPEAAVRFSVCTLLVQYGVPVEASAEATLWCERRVTAMTRADKVHPTLYDSGSNDPWTIKVIHGKYVQVWRRKGHDLFDDDEFYSLSDQKKVRLPEIPSVLHSADINLTMLERMLMRK